MNLQPQASFTVVRQIPNHLDSDTNYVRAVIRNAYTDAIIDTLNLTDKGSQRFSKNWQVPADPSGQGFYVSIVTSVYTDSGYTTKNGNYGDDENTYLVQERVQPLMRGGGSGIDAFTVRRIVAEELDKRPAQPLDAIYGAIGALQREINRVPKEIPERWDEVLAAIEANKPVSAKPAKPVDFAPVLKKIAAVAQALADKPVTPEADFSPLLDRLDSTEHAIRADIEAAEQHLTDAIGKETEALKGASFTIAPQTATFAEPKPEPVPFDPKSLAL